MRQGTVVGLVVVGALLLIGGERWYARQQEAYRQLEARRAELAVAVDSLSARVAEVDTFFVERARVIVRERTEVRDSLNRLLDSARARARACRDSTLDTLLARTETQLATERVKSDSVTALYRLRGDSLVSLDSLRRRQARTADSLLAAALRRLKPISRVGLGLTAGVDLGGRPNLVAGLTYRVRIPFISP